MDSKKNIINMTRGKINKNNNIKEQPTNCEKKYNIPSFVPKDIYMEINKCLYWPMSMEPSPKKVTTKVITNKDSLQNIKNKYTTEMFVFEEKIFVFPEEVTSMVRTSFDLSFVSPKSKQRFCCLCNEYVSDNLQKFYDHVRCLEHGNHFKKVIEDQKCFTLAKHFMRKISNDYIKCHGCDELLPNNQKASKKHVKSKRHKTISSEFHKHFNNQYNYLLKEFENCWYNVQMYACIPCNQIFQFKFNFLQHLGTVHKDEEDIMYDFCIPCATLWVVYKDKVAYTYSIHCADIMHKYLVNGLDFMIGEMPKHVKNFLNHAEETSEKLYKLSEDIFQNDLMQQELLQSLKSLLRPKFPAMELYPFGSRLTGLGFPSSDIDIFLDCEGDGYEKNDLSPLVYKYLDITKTYLCQDKENWVVQETLKNTRTPIIRLRHRLTDLQCDISFTNGLSVQNTKLIRSFNKACLPCRKLILFVKKWLSFCSLPGRNGITNYALTWLVIFYLQKNEGLPSIDTLIKKKNKSRIISGWETGGDFEIPIVYIEKSFNRLLMGFFDFYGDFNYKNYVACPVVGDVVKKQDFINFSNLPTAMNPYIRYLKQSCNSEMFRIDSSMCIQDPYDLSHNLTKAVQPLTLKAFKKYCRDSADIIRGILNH